MVLVNCKLLKEKIIGIGITILDKGDDGMVIV